jgi:FkbM family methyltransferase
MINLRAIIRKRLFPNPATITHEDIKKYLRIKNPVILEAGACDGRDTVRFAKKFPAAFIYAFEPYSVNYELVKARVSRYKNVNTYQLALSDKNGEFEMHINENILNPKAISGSGSLLLPYEHLNSWPNHVFNKREIVKTITLDSWAEEVGIDHIDALWLDMQGMEYPVLKASKKMLNTVKIIYSEVNLVELYKGCILYDDYRKWLNSIGFEMVKEEILGKEGGNALFVKKDYL